MSRVIRFNDVNRSYADQKAEIDAAISNVVARGDFINGQAVSEFEKAFADFCGSRYCVGASNGTSAIHMALFAAGIRPGDEVITTPMTFIATAEAISHCGARVVFADIHPGTLNLDASDAERRITDRTRAIIFVHLHGNPSGVREVAELVRQRNLVLIEDGAQAHGAMVNDLGGRFSHAGNLGSAGTFSFFPAKNLGAFGDAGAVITSDEKLALTARRMANHGREEKYRHLFEGYNYRLDTLQAAVLLVKLSRLREQVERRNRIAATYENRLSACGFHFQEQEPGSVHGRHLFVVHTAKRDQLQQYLHEQGIETGIHYPIALHRQPAYEHLGYKAGSFPIAEKTAETTLSLPLYPQMPDSDVELVCDAVCRFMARS
jgi:dTDP-4-amino-4,6-dideoxygalactose transaminase